MASGSWIAPNENDQKKQNSVIRQLLEGRSNAIGTVTLTHDGVATTTTVTAPNCGAGSIPFLFPRTANAASKVATTYVLAADVTSGQFIVTHDATANADETFGWVCFG